jgi:hypothetical protein
LNHKTHISNFIHSNHQLLDSAKKKKKKRQNRDKSSIVLPVAEKADYDIITSGVDEPAFSESLAEIVSETPRKSKKRKAKTQAIASEEVRLDLQQGMYFSKPQLLVVLKTSRSEI